MKGIRWLTVCAAILFAACLFCISAAARSITASGTCGAVATWALYDDGELVISGSGEMEDYTADPGTCPPWTWYTDSLSSLRIGEGITHIGNWAFYGCGFTGTLTLPDSVTSIGEYAFFGCGSLTGDLTIPGSVTTIGEWAFCDCSGFDGSLTIGNGVTTIGAGAFYQCSGIGGSVTIPSGVTSIGNHAFNGCRALTSAVFKGNAPVSFGTGVFNNCGDGFIIFYFDGKTGWRSPVWEGYDAQMLCRPGDVNGDGAVDTADYVLLARYLAGWNVMLTVPDAADYNGDGVTDGKDRYALARFLAGGGNG